MSCADGDQREVVGVRELAQFGQPGHGAVVVDHLGQHARLRQPGQPGQVYRGLGVPGAAQDAALGITEREYVTGPGQVRSRRGRVGERSDGGSAVSGGDAGADPRPRVHAEREGGAMMLGVVGGHLGKLEPVEFGFTHRHADHAAGVADHEGEQFGGGQARGEDDVALVLPVLIVYDHDRAARRDVLDRAVNVVEHLSHLAPSRPCWPRGDEPLIPLAPPAEAVSLRTWRSRRPPGSRCLPAT